MICSGNTSPDFLKRKGRGCAPPVRKGTRLLFGWRARHRGRFARVPKKLKGFRSLALKTCLPALAMFASVAASPAKATTYNALAGFSSANPSGLWSYGEGVTGSSFQPFTVYHSGGCVTVLGLACWEPSATVLYSPDVSYNTTGSNFWGTTFLIPDNALRIHPAVASDVIVQWKAPATATYSIDGFFELLDSAPSGLTGEVYDGSHQVYSGVLNGPAASQSTLTPGGSESFTLVETLQAGDLLSFGVNNNGNFLGDSTGFNVDISPNATPTPEPRSLAFAGLGMVILAWFRRLGRTPAN